MKKTLELSKDLVNDFECTGCVGVYLYFNKDIKQHVRIDLTRASVEEAENAIKQGFKHLKKKSSYPKKPL